MSYINKLMKSALLTAFILFSRPVSAAVLIVNSLMDDIISGNSECTLREAIVNANQDSDGTLGDCVAGRGNDIINLTALSGTITLTAQLEVTGHLQLRGPGAQLLTLDGNGNSRVFSIKPEGTVVIEGVTISGGSNLVDGVGGGIYNQGTLTLMHSAVSGNTAFIGGGILNEHWLTITDSTISSNLALEGGGLGNVGTVIFTNSTISENLALASGGIGNVGTMVLTNSTVADNESNNGDGAGIGSVGTLILKNTLLARNVGGDCYYEETSPVIINSLIEDGSCETFPVAGILLGPLANNGGSTLTHLLLGGSRGIDEGNNAICKNSPVNNLDQRGEIRPMDGNSDGVANCDIGAVESESSFNFEDNDGIPANQDNCPLIFNPDQIDTDVDGFGDACDEDDDGDLIVDLMDNCPLRFNPEQEDRDLDGIGNVCDEDDDGDLVADGLDNCPLTFNPGQEDKNQDGMGDACDELEVELTSFKVTPVAAGFQLVWQTASERDNAAFQVWRSVNCTEAYQTVITVIARGTASEGATYTYVDNSVMTGIDYCYLIETIDSRGQRNFHGFEPQMTQIDE